MLGRRSQFEIDKKELTDGKEKVKATRLSTKSQNQIGPGKLNHGKTTGQTIGQKAGTPPGMDLIGPSMKDMPTRHVVKEKARVRKEVGSRKGNEKERPIRALPKVVVRKEKVRKE